MLSRRRPTVVNIFYCYAHEDRPLQEKLSYHMGSLRRQGLVHDWHYREIEAGKSWKEEIDAHLEKAHIILLLISANFLNSDYCYGIEMMRALERSDKGETVVIPIRLRPVDIAGAPFSKLQMLPPNNKAVNGRDSDKVLTDIVIEIRKVTYNILGRPDPVDKLSMHYGLSHDRSEIRYRAPRKVTIPSNKSTKNKTNKQIPVQTLENANYQADAHQYKKVLPKKSFLGEIWNYISYELFPWLGNYLHENLNPYKFKKYSQKRIRSFGFFFFLAFDVAFATLGIYEWLHSPQWTFVICLVSLLLFLWMSINEDTFLAIVLTLLFTGAWCELGAFYLPKIAFIIILSASLLCAYLRFELFKPTNKSARRRRR